MPLSDATSDTNPSILACAVTYISRRVTLFIRTRLITLLSELLSFIRARAIYIISSEPPIKT